MYRLGLHWRKCLLRLAVLLLPLAVPSVLLALQLLPLPRLAWRQVQQKATPNPPLMNLRATRALRRHPEALVAVKACTAVSMVAST